MGVGTQVGGNADTGCHKCQDGDRSSFGKAGQATYTMAGGTAVSEAGPEPDQEAADEVGSGREGERGGGGGGREEEGGSECGEEEGREECGGEGVKRSKGEEGEEAGGKYACGWWGGKGKGGEKARVKMCMLTSRVSKLPCTPGDLPFP